jgi:hypothetical protein
MMTFEEARQHLVPPPLAPDVVSVDFIESCFGQLAAGQRSQLGQIPFTPAVLRASAGTHVLFPTPVLTLPDLIGRFPKLFSCSSDHPLVSSAHTTLSPLSVRWHLLQVAPVEGSEELRWDEQVALLGPDDEVPSATLVAFWLVLTRLLRKKYDWPYRFRLNTSDRTTFTDDDRQAIVRVDYQPDQPIELSITDFRYRIKGVKLASARKLPK